MSATTCVKSLDNVLNINNVVFVRIKDENGENIVSAAKYLGWETSVNKGGCCVIVNYNFILPNGNTLVLGSNNLKIYETIEDAIKDYPMGIPSLKLHDFLPFDDFAWMRNCIGLVEYAKPMWYWDGYEPIVKPMSYYYFRYWHNEEGYGYELLDKKANERKYYDTYDECLVDNRVKVMMF